jgi:glyoxylase-like metal-dependent hydrolase (beta-lactamase superfamily II)
MAGAWTEVEADIHVRQSRVFWMNSVVLADAAHTVVVDPGVLPSELDDLRAFMEKLSPRAVTLLFTHAHWDHVLGRPWWPKARTIAHDHFNAEVKRDEATIRGEADAIAAKHGERWPAPFAAFRADDPVSGLRFMKLDPWKLVLRDAPGHSDSQLSVHLPDRRVLIAADMLSDIEIPTLDGPIAPYRETLQALLLLAENGAIEVIVPGHGTIARGSDAVIERFRRDLDYLNALERGVRDAAAKKLSLEAAKELLGAMEYTGKRSAECPNEPLHMENIEHAYRARRSG